MKMTERCSANGELPTLKLSMEDTSSEVVEENSLEEDSTDGSSSKDELGTVESVNGDPSHMMDDDDTPVDQIQVGGAWLTMATIAICNFECICAFTLCVIL